MNADGTQDFPWELQEQKVELRLQGGSQWNRCSDFGNICRNGY